MKKWLLTLSLSAFLALPSFAQDIITKASPLSFEETVKFIESTINANKLKIFAKIDQQQTAKEVGNSINPATLFIFGNPKIGTGFMKENPVWVLDLPLKVAIYEDKDHKTFVSIYDMKKIAKRNKLSKEEMPKLEKMAGLLQKLLQ